MRAGAYTTRCDCLQRNGMCPSRLLPCGQAVAAQALSTPKLERHSMMSDYEWRISKAMRGSRRQPHAGRCKSCAATSGCTCASSRPTPLHARQRPCCAVRTAPHRVHSRRVHQSRLLLVLEAFPALYEVISKNKAWNEKFTGSDTRPPRACLRRPSNLTGCLAPTAARRRCLRTWLRSPHPPWTATTCASLRTARQVLPSSMLPLPTALGVTAVVGFEGACRRWLALIMLGA